MAQAYRTTYNINYRWKTVKDKTQPLVPCDKFCESLPEGDYWLVDKGHEDEDIDEKSVEALVRYHKKRNTTTYQTDFCKELKSLDKIGEEEKKGIVMNTLLEYGSDLYTDKTIKVLPPLATSRRLYSYLSPSNMFTPLTTYQKQIGKLGYELLKNNGQIPNSGEEFCEGAGDQPSPREEENKNYTVTINGEDLTISKIYNQKKRKFTCNCK